MPPRRWQQNLLLAAGSSIVAFLLGEAIARLAWHPPPPESSIIDPDPVLGWSLRSNGRLRIVDSDRDLDYTVVVNSLGMRDRERRQAPPSGTRRVLVLGDSFVYGVGVEAEQRFTERLEDEMGPGVELLNSGVGGWGTDQEYLFLLSRGLALHPDGVVLGVFLLNDVVNVMLEHALLAPAPKPHCTVENAGIVCEPPGPPTPMTHRRRLRFALQRSRLLYFTIERSYRLAARVRSLRRPDGSGPIDPPDTETEASHWSVFQVPYTARFETAFRTTEALITAMRDSCAARGIPFVLAAFPGKVEVDGKARDTEIRHYGLDPRTLDFVAPYSRLRSLAERLNVPLVYPLEEFRDAARTQPLYLERDGHMNANGHTVFARALAPALRAALASKPADVGARAPRTASRRP